MVTTDSGTLGLLKQFYSGLAKLPKFHSRKSKNSYKNSMMKQNYFYEKYLEEQKNNTKI